MKTIFITGSTDGIGKLAAIKFAEDGHEVYLHGRSSDKLNKTIEEIRSTTNNKNIKGFVADFSDLPSVKNMALQINKVVSKIDVLINNAGVFKTSALAKEEDIDIRLVVNYLAPYLLTDTLMPLVKRGAAPRIINLSSAAQSPISLHVLSGKEQVPVQEAYAQSKLALTMWSFNLAKTHTDVGIIAVNPGSLLNTKMANEAYGQYWSSADKGANIIHDLALSEEYNDITNKYFDNDKGDPKGVFSPAHAEAYDQDRIDQLISLTNTLLAKY